VDEYLYLDEYARFEEVFSISERKI